MEGPGITAVFSLAFGLGMLHALDADHVMAVSGLCSARPGWRTSLAFCLRWALGHGLSLLLIGMAVILFGMSIPVALSSMAESLVAVVLIGIGAYVIYDLWRRRAHLHFHHHDELPQHAHWHTHNAQERVEHHQERHVHRHGAMMVGVLHGMAGSAPLLALIPLSRVGSPWVAVAYLLVFSLGVLMAMLLFGGVLGGVYGWLSRWGNRLVYSLRLLVGCGAMLFGGLLLLRWI